MTTKDDRVPTKEHILDEIVGVLDQSGGLIDAAFTTPAGEIAVIATRDTGGPKGLFLISVAEARFEVTSA